MRDQSDPRHATHADKKRAVQANIYCCLSEDSLPSLICRNADTGGLNHFGRQKKEIIYIVVG